MSTRPSRPDVFARCTEGVRSHVVENLPFIRDTMEAAGAFTAMSGPARVVIGSNFRPAAAFNPV
jgi:hypothetical protein